MSKIMKFWHVFLSVLVMAFVFAACSDDEPGGSDKNVPTAVTESFKKSFPEATNVAWKQSQGYYLASFNMKAKGAALARLRITSLMTTKASAVLPVRKRASALII